MVRAVGIIRPDGWIRSKHWLTRGSFLYGPAGVNEGIVFEDRIFDPQGICIPANTLSGPKARVLLMLALTLTRDPQKIREIFDSIKKDRFACIC